ncbi:UDP-N-acetylglucosamine 1-carboxyvinyltransferase [Paraglaciecola sp.]|uniref:UDP-N-acetylglucosamine 1-carboxyvinyltransferase n=1 Tax=Paraglaciecola sp. TaxID=1920173 RepID=UPI00273D4E12|nr:UDP-N-acetylglucosamine 1-carboxyvinyltransferase [Paraglaciecola sp.]MDP5033261.1 UDP-N-acetylglucosamine 1-carboxyvinyltransferase [Paraglaciecola sp.]
MTKFKVIGAKQLFGDINISGAKNSLLPLICASLLSRSVILRNAPKLRDAEILLDILSSIGITGDWDPSGEVLYINAKQIGHDVKLLQGLVSSIRYSTILMGALIGAGCKKLEIAYPGGCSSFGTRPIDIHLVGFEALGADISILKNSIVISCESLNKQVQHTLRFPSVGATLNLILASAAVEGSVTLHNIATEPEVIDLIDFCVKLGFQFRFLKERSLEITPPMSLRTALLEHSVIPDRIETLSFMVLGTLLCKDRLEIKGANIAHTKQPRDFLRSMGVPFDIFEDRIVVYRSEKLNARRLTVDVYPGIGTDYQPLIAAVMSYANGVSEIIDPVYPKRFAYLDELTKMGLQSTHLDGLANIVGDPSLSVNGDFELECHDLRAGFNSLIFALLNDGKTVLTKAEQILRGYYSVVDKLRSIGADIETIN